MPSVLSEAALLTALGIALGLTANAVREDGLRLGRNHFPQGPAQVELARGGAPAPAPGPGLNARSLPPTAEHPAVASEDGHDASDLATTIRAPRQPDPISQGSGDPDAIDPHVAERLAAKGLAAVGHARAEALWRDPMHQEFGATLFIDARRAEQYAEAHIPLAYAFDPFYPERDIDALLPLLPTAQTIVVYCAGGECDDSESAALFLLQFGADPSTLFVYAGGMASWTAAGLPLEAGERGSGRAPETGP